MREKTMSDFAQDNENLVSIIEEDQEKKDFVEALTHEIQTENNNRQQNIQNQERWFKKRFGFPSFFLWSIAKASRAARKFTLGSRLE